MGASSRTPETLKETVIIADITTDAGRAIQAGDSMDGELLSVAIPISHFVVSDKSMAARLRRRGIDHEWKTDIFSLSTIHELLARLRDL